MKKKKKELDIEIRDSTSSTIINIKNESVIIKTDKKS